MMPEPSTAPQPEGWDPEEEDHSPCPQDDGDGDYSAGPDAASMEGAISKFMEGLEGQERSGFPQIHRLLSRTDPSAEVVDVLIQCMDWNIATRQSRIPEAELP